MSWRSVRNPILVLPFLLWAAATVPLFADEVTDWNSNLMQSLAIARTSPLASTRAMAIVHAAMYDAINGIERRYDPLHADFAAPAGASREAAVVEAAYRTMVRLFPTQAGALLVNRDASLAAIAALEAVDNQSIARGIKYGDEVAADILAWRDTDHFRDVIAPFLGGGYPSPFGPVPPWPPGRWQPTPTAFAPGAGTQFAIMTPWVMESHDAFRPGPPPALDSAEWAAAYTEVKELGSATSATRTADQTAIAQFWLNNSVVYWNKVARQLAAERHTTLSENARVFAMLNVTMADAAIACWDAKYYYVFWRPVTAIRLGATDGNAATVEDTTWTPIIDFFPPTPGTPAHPEYISGHSTISGAGAKAIANHFGDDSPFDLDSGGTPYMLQHFESLSAASRQVADARVYAGIHYRISCNVGRGVGEAVAEYISGHAFLPQNGVKKGQTSHTHGTGQCEGDGQVSEGGEL